MVGVQKKGGNAMDNQPIIVHIAAMLAEFEEMPLRAAYMVIKQLYDYQKLLQKE